MMRFCLILTGLTISAMSIGCCGPIGCGVDISMGHNGCGGVDCVEPVYRPLDGVRQLRGRWACGSGCAETYYGEWRSTPPDAQDPCCDQGCVESRGFCWSGCWQPGVLLRGLYGVRYCDDCGSDVGCDCEQGMTHEYMEEEVMPETAEPTVAMMTSGCDCPNCRSSKPVNAAGYSQEVQRSPRNYVPSSRTVSYRNAVPSSQRRR